MTDKRGQFKDSQFEDSRFEFWVVDRSQFGGNCYPYLMSTTKLVQDYSMVFHNSLVNDSVRFGLVKCYNLQI
jgi:hypothetical protein